MRRKAGRSPLPGGEEEIMDAFLFAEGSGPGLATVQDVASEKNLAQ
jgi:hypothetical protein